MNYRRQDARHDVSLRVRTPEARRGGGYRGACGVQSHTSACASLHFSKTGIDEDHAACKVGMHDTGGGVSVDQCSVYHTVTTET
jgi:hypothetical protein